MFASRFPLRDSSSANDRSNRTGKRRSLRRTSCARKASTARDAAKLPEGVRHEKLVAHGYGTLAQHWTECDRRDQRQQHLHAAEQCQAQRAERARIAWQRQSTRRMGPREAVREVRVQPACDVQCPPARRGENRWKLLANFENANLRKSGFEQSNLRGAKLMGTDLQGAYLYRTNLTDTDISGADLRDATLREANLYRANLAGANLSNAVLGSRS
jgi:hypothetical protein